MKCGCQVTSELEAQIGEEEEDSPAESSVTEKGLTHCLIISSGDLVCPLQQMVHVQPRSHILV